MTPAPTGLRGVLTARPAWLAAVVLAGALATRAPADPPAGEDFDNWTVECEEVEEAQREQCFIFQNLVLREGGQRVLRVAVGYLPDDETPIALVTLPLGISLPPGANVQVDDGEPIRFPIERCDLNGCRGGFRLEPVLLDAFKTGAQAEVTFHDSTRRPVTIPLSLQGFSAALRTLR